MIKLTLSILWLLFVSVAWFDFYKTDGKPVLIHYYVLIGLVWLEALAAIINQGIELIEGER